MLYKRVDGRDAEQELVSVKCYRFYNKTCQWARRGTGTGLDGKQSATRNRNWYQRPFYRPKKTSQSREVKRFLKNELPVPSRRSCMILLRTRSRLNASMLKSRSMPISPARWILLSESIALSISDIIVEGFMQYSSSGPSLALISQCAINIACSCSINDTQVTVSATVTLSCCASFCIAVRFFI